MTFVGGREAGGEGGDLRWRGAEAPEEDPEESRPLAAPLAYSPTGECSMKSSLARGGSRIWRPFRCTFLFGFCLFKAAWAPSLTRKDGGIICSTAKAYELAPAQRGD